MAKKVLRASVGDEFDFLLLGIVSQAREYKLCHFLNQKLLLTLQRVNDYEVMRPQNRQVLAFPLYSFEPEDAARYFLFSNKTTGGFLVPDMKNIDYFLMVKDYHNRVEAEILLREIKEISLVLGAYALQADQLKARENLVF